MSDDPLKALSTKASFRFLTDYMAQTLIATAGAVISGFIIAGVAGLIELKIRGPEFFSSSLTNNFLGEPYFVIPITLALVLGFWGQKWFRTSAGYFLWMVTASILLSSVVSWRSYSSLGRWQDAWANFFGHDCSGSECFYEWTVTAPFYTSAAYTLAWIAGRKVEKRHATLPFENNS
jgi:hypothetical protein